MTVFGGRIRGKRMKLLIPLQRASAAEPRFAAAAVWPSPAAPTV